MVQPLLAPNPYADTTSGVPYAPTYTGPQTTTRTIGTPSNPYAVSAQGATRPGGAYPSPAGYGADYVTPEQWQQYIDTLKQAYQASSGFERLQLQAKIDDAEKGRQNSLQVAQLQAGTSRYGTDVQRQTAIDELKQKDQQFAANHGLDVAKLTGVYNGAPTLEARGQQLTEAQLIAQQRSQPNRLFQTMDLEQALGSIRNGQRATTMPMTGVAAVDRLSTDYQGNPYLAGGGSPGGGPSASSPLSSGQGSTGTGAPPPDPRLKALNAVMTALPPSATEGLDPNGVAALNAAFALYHAPGTARPGTIESLDPTQKATFQSAGDRLQQYTGVSPDDWMSQYTRQAPGQQNPRAA